MTRKRDVYAVDLDGTLAYDESYTHDPHHIGAPVPPMLQRVKRWLAEGREVWIFTARLSNPDLDRSQTISAIQDWCEEQGLPRLKVTNRKDNRIVAYFDDRAYHVLRDQGIVTDTIEEQ